ncbi:hypothetical protein BDB00DRAFT_789864 [Zychaea mexicana]|uniref:uncharacterized protein n=1 Tax=Zychaea mexicana TaxID=64656 RepID=UPI0022FED58B|nr:uncharacterized protein BDB00DRAFT_789864 [Zychaea mexicana]KAI9491069.1 hypothetical protein BDB00DRAFT_789864 [Zychaea mexicana]
MMMPSLAKRLLPPPGDKEAAASPKNDDNGTNEASSTTTSRWQGNASFKSTALTTWCTKQRKQLMMLHRRAGADTAMTAVASKLLRLEKSTSAMISGHHHHRQQEIDEAEKQHHDDTEHPHHDKQQHKQERVPSSASEPVLRQTVARSTDESKLSPKVALFERATELGWIKKVFRRNRTPADGATGAAFKGGKAAIIPPADFPNESTMNICALVEQGHGSGSCEKTQHRSESSNEPHLPIYNTFNGVVASEEDTVEEPQDANSCEFSAYCDKVLFGRYTL